MTASLSTILLFATVLAVSHSPIHVAGQNETEEQKKVFDVCKKWLNVITPVRLKGMGILGNYFYIADDDWNMVRVPADQFSVSGEGTETTASVDLSKNAKVLFNFEALLYYAEQSIRNKLSVFFMAPDGTRRLANDSFAFFHIAPEVYKTMLRLAPLHNFSLEQHHWCYAKNHLHHGFKMITSDWMPIAYYPELEWTVLDFKRIPHYHMKGEVPVAQTNALVGDLRDAGRIDGGYYQRIPNRFFLLKEFQEKIEGKYVDKLEVRIYTDNTLVARIPYKNFFLCDSVGPFSRISYFLVTSIFGMLIVLLVVVYCCFCVLYGGKTKGGTGESSRSKLKKPKKAGKITTDATPTANAITPTPTATGKEGSSSKGFITTPTPLTPRKTTAPKAVGTGTNTATVMKNKMLMKKAKTSK